MKKNKVNRNKIAFYLISLYGGGGEKVVLDLAKGFIGKGYQVDLLLFSREGHLENYIDKDINIIDLKSKRIFTSLFSIIRYLRKEQSIFILGTSEHANLILILAKLLSRVKTKIFVRVGMTFSDLFQNYKNRRDRFIPFLVKILYPRADRIIANSQNVAKDLEKVSKIPREKIEIIYNPKFIKEIWEKSKRGNWKFPKKFTILAVGRLEKQKDFETLLKAFALVKKNIDAQLIILGEGGQRQELEKLILALDLEDVHLEGFQTNPYFYMANSDIFVSTSLWEGFSNSLIEAGILGLPIVATDCGSGTRELLAPQSDFNKTIEKGKIEYGENGVLVAKQDVSKIAEAILTMAEDKELRENYSQKIKANSEEFATTKILTQYEGL